MNDNGVGRNDRCPCGSGKKFKHCCLHKQSAGRPHAFGYLPAAPLPSVALRTAYSNGAPKQSALHPNLTVKVFVGERKVWADARLADLKTGHEFIAGDRLYKVFGPDVYAADALLDVSKIPEADRPFDPANWRVPTNHDVVYAFGEDGTPDGHCLLGNLNPGQRCVFQGLIYDIQAGPTPDTCTLIGKGEVDRRRDDPLYVWLEYTIHSILGAAIVGYGYPLGRRIPLVGGALVAVEAMAPGMVFHLERGGTARVTKVGRPQRRHRDRVFRDPYGNGIRNVVGTFQFTGWVQLMTVTVDGEVHEVTPGHPYWSVTRQGWHPIESFVAGELLLTKEHLPIPIQVMTAPRWLHETVYNVEVDEHHNYFVGRGKTAVWAHNGLGEGCGVPKAAEANEDAATPTEQRTLFHYTNERGLKGINSSETLHPSLKAVNPNDVRYGEGQYLSDIVPGTKTPGQLSYAFLNDPRGWRRFTHYVEIDVTGLTVVEGRPGVYVVPNTTDLNLTGRIVSSGKVPKP